MCFFFFLQYQSESELLPDGIQSVVDQRFKCPQGSPPPPSFFPLLFAKDTSHILIFKGTL